MSRKGLLIKRFVGEGLIGNLAETLSVRPSCHGRWILICLSIILVVFRQESYLVSPRFWAEEGVVFFSFARTHGVIEAFLQPHLGYYSLLPNLASILAARVVSLENAPLVTTLVALGVQCLPLCLVVFGRGPYWQGLIRKTVVVAIIFLAPLSYEVWLNTINSQFYLCLFTLLLLLEPPPAVAGRFSSWSLRLSLCLAGLTGVLSCLLVPLYWLRALIEKKREVVVWALILSACTLVQLAVVVKSGSAKVDAGVITAMGLKLPVRSVHIDPPTLGSILMVKNGLLNFFGLSSSASMAKMIHGWYVKAGIEHQLFGYGSLILLASLMLGLSRRIPGAARYLLPGGFVSLVVPSTALALVSDLGVLIGPYAAHRYYFVPNVLVLLMVTCAIDWENPKRLVKPLNMACLFLLCMAVFGGVRDFRNFQGVKGQVYDVSWPRWKEEIARWRKDSSYPVKLWPAPQWQMTIDP